MRINGFYLTQNILYDSFFFFILQFSFVCELSPLSNDLFFSFLVYNLDQIKEEW